MKKAMTQEQKVTVFRLMLVLTSIAIAAVVTLIVFSFMCVATLGMLTCLFVGLGMALLVLLTVLTVLSGLAAYRS